MTEQDDAVDTIEQDVLTDDATDPTGEVLDTRAARNARERAKRAARGARSRAPRGAKTPRAPRERPAASEQKVTKEQIQALHQTVTMVGMVLVTAMPPQLQPTSDEFGNMVEPLERITLRHMPATGAINPDARDAGMFTVAFVWYVVRLYRSGAFVRATVANTPAVPVQNQPRPAAQQARDMSRQAAGPATPTDDPLADAFKQTSSLSKSELAALVG